MTTTASNSIIYLVDKGVRLINMSMYAFTPELNEAFDYARRHDVLVVVGAGNSDRQIPATFRDRDHIIVAGASLRRDFERGTDRRFFGGNWYTALLPT